jgi:hypothetical protein
VPQDAEDRGINLRRHPIALGLLDGQVPDENLRAVVSRTDFVPE